jgi:hypothetical protein
VRLDPASARHIPAKLRGMRNGVRPVTVVALVAGVVLLVLVVAQLVLPRIAAHRISSRIGRYGKVEHVSVSAWPAIKLLWGDVDSADVQAGRLALSPAQASSLLWESRGVQKMDLSASSVELGSLALEGVSLRKRGAQLSGEGSTTAAQANAALPAGVSLALLGSRDGKVEVRAGGGLFGIDASVNAVAEASDGKLVAHPVGFLIQGFQLSLFSDPHVHVEAVGAQVMGRDPLTNRLSMEALLG